MSDERQARRFFVSGAVQGVGYRFFAQRAAERLGVTGYVKNLRDGRVEVYALAQEAVLERLRTELQRGPGASRVSGVEEKDASIDQRFTLKFSVEYDDQ